MSLKTLSSVALLCVATTLTSSAFADIAPYPEELACSGQEDGEACSFISWMTNEEVTGACQGGLCVASEDAGMEAPEAGETPEAGAETPVAGAETPSAGAETPVAGAETPVAGAETAEDKETGCEQGAQGSASLMMLALGLLGLALRRRSARV